MTDMNTDRRRAQLERFHELDLAAHADWLIAQDAQERWLAARELFQWADGELRDAQRTLSAPPPPQVNLLGLENARRRARNDGMSDEQIDAYYPLPEQQPKPPGRVQLDQMRLNRDRLHEDERRLYVEKLAAAERLQRSLQLVEACAKWLVEDQGVPHQEVERQRIPRGRAPQPAREVMQPSSGGAPFDQPSPGSATLAGGVN